MELAARQLQLRTDLQPGPHWPPRRVLVEIDPTAHGQPALDKAVTIATQCGACLELYVRDVEQQIPESWAGGERFEEYRELRRKRLLEDLAALVQPLRDRGLAVDVVCEWHGSLEPGLCEHAIRTQPDLVVKQTHRHAPLACATPSDADWHLISVVPVPLLLVRARAWSATVGIAAAVDPCHPARRLMKLDASIMECARTLAGVVGGTLELYHVLPTLPHPGGERGSLEQVATTIGAGARFIQGQVPDGLTRLAEQHRPDILVVGAPARSQSSHSAAGGAAAHLLERVECDLLVVKTRGFAAPMA